MMNNTIYHINENIRSIVLNKIILYLLCTDEHFIMVNVQWSLLKIFVINVYINRENYREKRKKKKINSPSKRI